MNNIDFELWNRINIVQNYKSFIMAIIKNPWQRRKTTMPSYFFVFFLWDAGSFCKLPSFFFRLMFCFRFQETSLIIFLSEKSLVGWKCQGIEKNLWGEESFSTEYKVSMRLFHVRIWLFQVRLPYLKFVENIFW